MKIPPDTVIRWQPKIRILIVDDDPAVGDMVSQVLESLGYDSACCLDPSEALIQLEEGDFNVLLTDYRMPEMNGVELANQAKKAGSEVAVILMTGYARTMKDNEMQLDPIHLILNKPLPMDRLDQAIKQAVERKSSWY